MAARGTFAVIAEEVALAFIPLAQAVESPDAFRELLRELGWSLATLPPELNTLHDPVLAVDAFLSEEPISDDQSGDALAAENVAIEAITHLKDEPGLPADFRSQFPDQLLDYLIVEHLLTRRPRWGYLLWTLGLLRVDLVDAAGGRPAYEHRVFLLSELENVLADPLGFFKSGYHWGQSDFEGKRLIQGLTGFLRAWDFRAEQERLNPSALAQLKTGAVAPTQVFDAALLLAFFRFGSEAETVKSEIGFFLLPETASDKPGFALLPSIGPAFKKPFALTDTLTLTMTSEVDLIGGGGILVRPAKDVEVITGLASGTPTSVNAELGLELALAVPGESVLILGHADGSRLEVGGVSTRCGTRLGTGGPDVFTELGFEAGRIVIKPSTEEADSLVSELLPADGFTISFELIIGFSTSRGVYFSGSGGFEIDLPAHLKIGPIEVVSARLAVRVDDDGSIPIDLTATVAGDFSILQVVVQNIGLRAPLTFPEEKNGNLGAANLDLTFRPPNGAGVLVNAGPVTGGGFLFWDLDTGRYSGAVELGIFGISVKAFGVIDTRFPDGTKGLSLVIVISAEFTPIQLGFGFTLVGVGGLLGVHRTVDERALGEAVRTGSLAHLLFPVNVVLNAPAIVHDLATVFPARRNHHLIGPMAKLGWGTPTLITADIGVIIEFPGPRLALLGVVRMLLPSADFAILRLNAAIGGVLDFPAGRFEINASLFDSFVAGYVVSGDMAFRMELGDRPSFLMSVGGFNPGFRAPAGFPSLRRASADLGVNGNPSLTATGYFALTSNSAQFGASVQLRASGYGIRLTGGYGFDVLFVFSPFRFTASVHAGVRVSFHGFGLGVTLHGSMSGPTPWRFTGRVCVEVAIWDACLPIDVTFGREQPAALPEMDPWLGTGLNPNIDPRVQVIGLGTAVSDPRNWEGEQPPDGYSVVSLAQAATTGRTPIDPVGPAVLRQKVCPLEQELEKFGEYVPIVNTRFNVSSVSLGGIEVEKEFVEDAFARGQFENLSNAEKLSADSYDEMIAGVRLAPDRVRAGTAGTRTLEYETVFVTAQGERVPEEASDPRFIPTRDQLLGMLKRSAAGRGGVRRSGVQKYMLTGRPKLLTLDTPTFIVVDACTHVWNIDIVPIEVSQTAARLKLKEHVKANPADEGRFAVVPFWAKAA